jgi:hypothetical protein
MAGMGPTKVQVSSKIKEYEVFAGPHGRVIAKRLKKLKRWIFILIGISVLEFIAVVILFTIFMQIYTAFERW